MSKTKFTLVTVWLMLILFCAPFSTIRAQFSGGNGSLTQPYLISSVAGLDQMRADAAASASSGVYYRLDANITLTAEWNPIGTMLLPFEGHFDGNNLSILGLWINKPLSSEPIGLFGAAVAPATFKNVQELRLSPAGVRGGTNVGAFVGYADGCNITNCQVSYADVAGTSSVGGFAGHVTGGEIKGCRVSGVPPPPSLGLVTAAGNDAGGFVGSVGATQITGCFAEMNVVNGAATLGTGGFVGRGVTAGAIFNLCYATGSVSGAFNVGGFIGAANASGVVVNNSYSMGDVNAANMNGGGFVGVVGAGAAINNCAAGGATTAGANEGTFVGSFANPGTINNVWYPAGIAQGTGAGVITNGNDLGVGVSPANAIGFIAAGGAWVNNPCLEYRVWTGVAADVIADVLFVENIVIAADCTPFDIYLTTDQILALDTKNRIPDIRFGSTAFDWIVTSITGEDSSPSAPGAVTGARYMAPVTTGIDVDELELGGMLINNTNEEQTIVYTVNPSYDVYRSGDPVNFACAGAPFTVTFVLKPRPDVVVDFDTVVCSDDIVELALKNGDPSSYLQGHGRVPHPMDYTWTVLSGNSSIANGGNGDTNAADGADRILFQATYSELALLETIPI